ncbi:MAG: GDP-mannose 4,6-dehydratase [Oscillospiraceae bacterium]|nr:GDP-mannose 4,6-dehydratase [Oscillospiraceae bacterium]
MKALVIGAGGFVGGYLISELSGRGWEVCATKLPHEKINIFSGNAVSYGTSDLDILDENAVAELLGSFKPDCIFHLAAQSSVALSWKKPALTADINIKGCINLLEAVRSAGISPRILFIGSSEEYGYAANRPEPVDENVRPEPANIYAITKLTQNMIGELYCKAYGMDIISVRAFNHIGPGQLPQFVVADFCRQAAEIKAGTREPVIHVGNLSAKRDFTDVRDIVRAYAELSEKGRGGETYNVGSGHAVSIQSVLDKIIELSGVEIKVDVDKTRFRPVDVPFIEADVTKLKIDTGWERNISLEKSVRDILAYFQGKV